MSWVTAGWVVLMIVAAPIAYLYGRWIAVRRIKSGRLR
jgi:cytochrome c-type biogenesis protein CcmH/NrfG